MTLNTLQFVIQDTFLKKSDFEITDLDVMKKYYDCTNMEDLETSLTKTTDMTSTTEMQPGKKMLKPEITYVADQEPTL